MQAFEDLKGRKWELSITVGAVKRVLGILKIDITDLSEDGFIDVVATDPVKMIDMIWILLESQAKSIAWKNEDDEMQCGVSEEEFGEGFAGDVIDTAILAFTKELTDFFPKAKRDVTRQLFAKTNRLVELGYKEMFNKMELVDEQALLDKIKSVGDPSAS